MIKIYSEIGIVMLFCLFFSCSVEDDSPPYPPYKKKSYIQNFVDIDTLTITERINLNIIGNTIDLSYSDLINEDLNSIDDNIYFLLSAEEKKKYINGEPSYYTQISYDEKYCKLIGDTTYNASPIFGLSQAPIAIIDTIVNITVTCDKYFSIDKPKGTNLSNFFFIYFENPYLIVTNQYHQPKSGYKLSSVNYDIFPHIMTGGLMNQILFEKSPFIGNTFVCQLLSSPDITDDYIFTFTLQTTSKKKLSVSSKPMRIKGSDN